MSSDINRRDGAVNKASIQTARQALRDLPQDRERVIQEAHAKWLAEKQKREATRK